MKTQMNLTLFIGDVLVGVVVLVIGLILAWGVVNNTADACKIGAGVGSDISSLVQSEFSVPGEVTFLYKGPAICRTDKNVFLKCSPTKGWNPNITTLSISTYDVNGGFGFDRKVPLAMKVSVGIEWIQNNVHKNSKLPVYGLLTYNYASGAYIPGEEQSTNKIEISKTTSVFGSMLGSNIYFDPIGSSDGIVNTIFSLNNSCTNGGIKYVVKSYTMPASYELAWNSTSICVYHLILNSHVLSLTDISQQYYAFGDNSVAFGKEYGPYDMIFTTNKSYSGSNTWYKDILFNTSGAQYNRAVLVSGFIYNSDEGTLSLGGSTLYLDEISCVDCKNLVKSGSKYTCGGTPTSCASLVYDPYNQNNVKEYHTGWLKERCFNLESINKHVTINSTVYAYKRSDGMMHTNFYYYGYNSPVAWRFNITYDCSDNRANVTLIGVES